MHTTTTSSMSFCHNGDFSGAVLFSAPLPPLPGQTYPDTYGPQFAVPFASLVSAARSAGDAEFVDLEVRGNGQSFRNWYSDETYLVRLPVIDLRELIGSRVIGDRIAAIESTEYADAYALAVDDEVARWAADSKDAPAAPTRAALIQQAVDALERMQVETYGVDIPEMSKEDAAAVVVDLVLREVGVASTDPAVTGGDTLPEKG